MASSYKGYVEKIDANGLVNDRPCDTYRVNTMLDNLRHMCDSAQCYRVNYVAGVDSGAFGTNGITLRPRTVGVSAPYFITQCVVFEFPLLILYDTRYPNFDVRVAASISDDSEEDLSIGVVIGHVDTPVPTDIFSIPYLPNIVGYLLGTSSSAGTVQTIIDGLLVQTTADVSIAQRQVPMTDLVTGGQSSQYVAMARAYVFIHAVVPDAADYVTIDLVQIREYTP